MNQPTTITSCTDINEEFAPLKMVEPDIYPKVEDIGVQGEYEMSS